MDQSIEVTSVESLPEYFSESSMLKLSDDKLKEVGEKCRERLQQLKDLRTQSKYDYERQLDFNSYHLVPPARQLPYAGYPNLACPLPRIGVDTFHSNVMFTFAGQEGTFKVLPDFLSKSHMDVAARTAEYMTYCINYESGLWDALDKADMDAEKYDNGFLKAVYVTEEAWETINVTEEKIVPEVDELTGEVKRKTVKTTKKERVKKTLFDGAKSKRLSPDMVFASPFYETIEDAVKQDYVFEVQTYNVRVLNELSIEKDKSRPAFFKKSQVEKLKDMKRSAIVSRLEQNKKAYDGYQVERELELTPIELAEAHFMYDVNGDGLSEKVAVVLETQTGVVLRATYGKCRIRKITPRPVDGRWSGESIRKATAPLIVEWEAIHNQRVAKGQWENLPFFFYKAGGRFNPQVVTLMPGRGYPVDDPSSVNFPQTPSVGISYFQEEKLIMDYFDRVLALGDVIQGIQGQGDASATNTIHSQQRAGIRLSTPMNRIARAVEQHIEDLWELNRECAPKSKEYRVVGMGDVPVWSKIGGSDYAAQVSFKIHMATMYDVQMLRDTALLNYRTFMGNPLFMQDPAAFYHLTTQTMQAVGLKVPLVKPEQAKAKSPFLEHDMIREGQDLEPTLGEDTDEHMKAHLSFMQSDDFENWPEDRRQSLMVHYDKTQIQKQTLAAANLNQAGVFPGMPGGMMASAPAMTATRNPSQTMNNMRVGETGKSMMKQPMNGMMGANNAQ